MLPTSDFEFAVLLDKEFIPNLSRADSYFTAFTNLLKSKLQKIGIKMDGTGIHPLSDIESNGKNRLIETNISC